MNMTPLSIDPKTSYDEPSRYVPARRLDFLLGWHVFDFRWYVGRTRDVYPLDDARFLSDVISTTFLTSRVDRDLFGVEDANATRLARNWDEMLPKYSTNGGMFLMLLRALSNIAAQMSETKTAEVFVKSTSTSTDTIIRPTMTKIEVKSGVWDKSPEKHERHYMIEVDKDANVAACKLLLRLKCGILSPIEKDVWTDEP